MAERPYVVGALAMVWGYLRAMVTGAERYGDPDYRRARRRFEWHTLLFGKQRALQRIDREIREKSAAGK
jgi:hypothetical protein